MFSTRYAVAVLFAALASVSATYAWGPLGHSVVAAVAQKHLRPAAGDEVARLLALEHATSLADIANWPDEIRDDAKYQNLWKETRMLHYVNFSKASCKYVSPRDCKNGECVVEAVSRYLTILSDWGQPDAVRLKALKFVVHFVGDLHQPLHAGYRNDDGGNAYPVQFHGKRSNLHRVWDSGLLSTRGLDLNAYAELLEAKGAGLLPQPMATLDKPAVQWAEESCRITRSIYPANHKIDQTYIDAQLPVADSQLREASRRLAEVLNVALQH